MSEVNKKEFIDLHLNSEIMKQVREIDTQIHEMCIATSLFSTAASFNPGGQPQLRNFLENLLENVPTTTM